MSGCLSGGGVGGGKRKNRRDENGNRIGTGIHKKTRYLIVGSTDLKKKIILTM